MALRVRDEGLTTRVGAAVLAVTAAAIVFVVTVLDRLDAPGVEVRIYFGEITAVSEGAPVQLAGRAIGSLTAISLVPATSVDDGHPLHGTGGVVAVARIDPAWAPRVPINSEFFLSANSAFAPRYLEIGPPRGAQPGRGLVDGDQVRGIDPPSLDRVLQRTWDNLTDIQEFADGIRPATDALRAALTRVGATVAGVEPLAGQWVALDAAAGAAIDEAVALAVDVRAGGLDVDGAGRLIARLRDLAARVAATVADLRARVLLLQVAAARIQGDLPPDLRARIDAGLAEAQAALGQIDALAVGWQAILDDVVAGHNTIGAILADDELVDDVKEMTKMMKRQPWRVVIKSPR